MTPALQREIFDLPREPAADTEIFAIGDIHGRPDLLEALIAAAEGEERRALRRELVFLGDLVDRGPDTLGAIGLAIDAREYLGADEVHFLMGNHEAMMRMALEPATPRWQADEALANWGRNGGWQTLAEMAPDIVDEDDASDLLELARSKTPKFVSAWLASLISHVRSGGLMFVHAGVNPEWALDTFLATPWNTPLSEIDESNHWTWVREPFLSATPGPQGFSGFFVVHGHSPCDLGFTRGHAEQIGRFRLNLDGGSGHTGKAKLAIFRGRKVEVLTVSGPTNREL
jgi:serine/threonine protein phosphatase 1